MELSSLELSSSIENLRERGLSVVESTRSASAEFASRTQRLTTEWLVESERKLLTGLLETLRELDSRIQRRLELLGRVTEIAPSRSASPAVEVPIEDYDLYTAKEIISELAELSAEAAKAILEYEKAHKARATVIRAAEQKLVA